MRKQHTNLYLVAALIFGVLTGLVHLPFLMGVVHVVGEIFIKLLRLISLPILFFAMVSTIANLDSWEELAIMGRRIIRYTLMTTYISALIGLVFLYCLHPIAKVSALMEPGGSISAPELSHQSYWHFLWKIIPDNFVAAFSENNVLGVAFIGVLLGLAILQLEEAPKKTCQELFSALLAAILKIAGHIIAWMPLGVWAFVSILVESSRSQPDRLEQLFLYTVCVIGANLVQGFIILPLFLKSKGIAPQRIFKGMLPALITAFFTKSSSATMPLTLSCLTDRLQIKAKTANTVVPLCTIINMNGCAAFIVVTVLFVSMSHGITFNLGEMFLWTLMATVAAVGNAGVPMGCYFLASAFLLSMNVPLTLMGWILPVYLLLDMIETALNVWSDACITVVVGQEERG